MFEGGSVNAAGFKVESVLDWRSMLFLNSNIASARCLVLVAAILRDSSLYSVNESVGDRNVCFISCSPLPMIFQSHFFRLNECTNFIPHTQSTLLQNKYCLKVLCLPLSSAFVDTSVGDAILFAKSVSLNVSSVLSMRICSSPFVFFSHF